MMHTSTFEYLKPTPKQLELMESVRAMFKDAHDNIEQCVAHGRYKALCLTALEEAAMWANKGITRDSDGSPRP